MNFRYKAMNYFKMESYLLLIREANLDNFIDEIHIKNTGNEASSYSLNFMGTWAINQLRSDSIGLSFFRWKVTLLLRSEIMYYSHTHWEVIS